MERWNKELRQQIASFLKDRTLDAPLEALFDAVSVVYDSYAEVQSIYKIALMLQDRDPTYSVYTKVCREIADVTNFPLVQIQLFQRETAIFKTAAIVGAGTLVGEIKRAEIAPNETFTRGGERVFKTDDLSESGLQARQYQTLQARSVISVPMKYQSLLLGTITVAHPKSGASSDRIAMWLSSVAAQIALEIERRNINEVSEQQKVAMFGASKMSELGRMAGGVAHEINTPLATILLLAGQIRDDAEKQSFEALDKTAEKIEKTVRRISSIIKGLKTFSRDGSRDPFAPANLAQVVEDTFALAQERFKHGGVALKVEAAGDLRIKCQETQISQLLLNLLNNAFDAVQALPEKWVEVEFHSDAEAVEVWVTDSGGGIPEPVRQKLGLPFFTTKPLGSGTGIGLGICFGIAKSHGGSLRVDEKCKNTRFILRLPRDPDISIKAA